MKTKYLQDAAQSDIIIVTGERAECPTCHRNLPGVFPAGATASGVVLRCRGCKKEYKVFKYASGPRHVRPASDN